MGRGMQDAIRSQLESGGLKVSDQSVRTRMLSGYSESLPDLL